MEQRTTASALIKGFIKNCLGINPDFEVIPQDSLSHPVKEEAITDLTERLSSLEDFLEKFVSHVNQKIETQRKINEVIKDEMGLMASLQDDPPEIPVKQIPRNTKFSIAEEVGLKLDDPDPAPEKDPQTDRELVGQTVVNYLSAQKDSKCYIQWLVKSFPDSPEAQTHIKRVTNQIPKADRRRVKDLVVPAFGTCPICLIIYEEIDGIIQFWSGRKWERDWKRSKFYELESDIAKKIGLFKKSIPSAQLKYGNLTDLLENGVISYGEV